MENLIHQPEGQGLQTLSSTEFSLEQKKSFNIIKDLNLIVAFKLTDIEVMEMATTILRLKPDVTPEIIRTIMDKFLTGFYEYEKDKGIVNFMEKIDQFLLK